MTQSKQDEKRWPPRVWVNPRHPVAAWINELDGIKLSHVEYLSLEEHTAEIARLTDALKIADGALRDIVSYWTGEDLDMANEARAKIKEILG